MRPEIRAKIDSRVRSRRRVRELNRRIGDGSSSESCLLIFLYKSPPPVISQKDQAVTEYEKDTHTFDETNAMPVGHLMGLAL